ncbi:hypothetical protein I4U23_005195 [Adineta vaga]|nr:hypothetical protein I4U23_005195 [Adineta vaga]
MGPFLTPIQTNILRCHLECNQRIACRLFEFDQDPGECRLWSDDLTTGMISLDIPSKPRSKVGMIQMTSNIYLSLHNQPCDKHAKSHLGFECRDIECNSIYQCLNQAIARFGNAASGGGVKGLSGPWGLHVTSDNTLYVTDYNTDRVQTYSSLSRSGITIAALNRAIKDVFEDNLEYVYTAAIGAGDVFVSPINITLPISRLYPCNLSSIYSPYVIAVDKNGNIYISDFACHVVSKWVSNATTGGVVTGKLNTVGSSNSLLNGSKFIFLDEIHSTLYVVDYNNNNRVQKFFLGVNTTVQPSVFNRRCSIDCALG